MAHALKLISLIRTGGSVDDLRRTLETRVEEGFPGLTRLLLNRVLPVEVRASPGAAQEKRDAVVESWFTTQADLEAWKSASVPADCCVHLSVDQRLIHDSGIRPLPAKVMVTFRRRADLSRAEAQTHWQGRHVEVGLVEHNATDFLRLYFQNHVVDGNAIDRPEHDYDGLPEFWLDQEALAQVGAESPVMKAIAEDEANFIDRNSIVTLLLDEEELFSRDAATSGWPPIQAP